MDIFVEIVRWVFTIIGVIAAGYQFVGFYQQKKLEKPYEEAFRQFSQNLEGKYTQEQITSLKEELRKLESQIDNDIPTQARMEFLENQKKELEENINQLYSRYQSITSELEKMSNVKADGLSPKIIQVINEKNISGNLLETDFQQRLLRLLAIILALTIILNLDVILSIIPSGNTITIDSYRSIDYPVRWIVPLVALFFVIGCFWNSVLRKTIMSVIEKMPNWLLPVWFFGLFIFMGMFMTIVDQTSNWAERCLAYSYDCFTESNILQRMIFLLFSSSVAIISILPLLHSVNRIFQPNRLYRKRIQKAG